MTSVVDENPVQYPITFRGHHGLYSCTFSADGNEIIAGGNGNISGAPVSAFVNCISDKIQSTICLAVGKPSTYTPMMPMSIVAVGQILPPGTYWLVHQMTVSLKFGMCHRRLRAVSNFFHRDRRSLGASPKPSGVLIGHTEGITYVSAKGDGRYVISNGKDQSVRLWDLRKLRSPADYSKIANKSYGIPGFDYRCVITLAWKRVLLDTICKVSSIWQASTRKDADGL